MKKFLGLAVLAAVLCGAMPAAADIVHDEGLDGDLSGVFGAPTSVDFNSGANTVIGQVGENGNTGATDGSDADYFTVVIDPGDVLFSINVDARSGVGGSFFGYRAGTSFPGQGAGDIDGFVIFSDTAGEILDDLLGGPGSLGPGSWSFWIQETAPGTVDYQFTFGVGVPEPASAYLGMMACLGLAGYRRRKQ